MRKSCTQTHHHTHSVSSYMSQQISVFWLQGNTAQYTRKSHCEDLLVSLWIGLSSQPQFPIFSELLQYILATYSNIPVSMNSKAKCASWHALFFSRPTGHYHRWIYKEVSNTTGRRKWNLVSKNFHIQQFSFNTRCGSGWDGVNSPDGSSCIGDNITLMLHQCCGYCWAAHTAAGLCLQPHLLFPKACKAILVQEDWKADSLGR